MKALRLSALFLGTVVISTGCDLKSVIGDIVNKDKKDGGSSTDGGSNAPCNALANNASVISKSSNAGPTPTPTGGTIEDGTYFLTRMDKYNGVTGSSTHQETWVFAGTTIQVVTNNETDNGAANHYTGTYTTSGTNMNIQIICPVMMTATFPYSATSTEIVMVNADDPNETHTFTKQQ